MDFTRRQVLSRYRTVVRVVSRHGLGFLVEWAGLLDLPGIRRLRGPFGEGEQGRGERIRRACEDLGPAFVKLGQLLSTRADLLPPDIVTALERLQDQVTPFPFSEVVEVLESEFGGPISERLAYLDQTPLAAASLGQVHPARLADGGAVVLKVQRPGVARQVDLDLHLLQQLARLAAQRSQAARRYDLPGIAREFATVLRAELDFEQEGRNVDRFRLQSANDPDVYFPVVHWDLTTRRVLTLERVGGMRVTDRAALLQAGIAPTLVAGRLTGAMLRMALRDGFFHADPHPGNMFVGPTGIISFVDMGMVGELTPAMRENVIDYVLGVVTRDPDRVVRTLLRMGVMGPGRSTVSLRAEVDRLHRRYGEIPLREVRFGDALRETMDLARQFEFRFPTGYALLLKSLGTLESVVRQIDPDATLVGLATPYAHLLLRERLRPARLAGRIGHELLETGRSLLQIPGQFGRVLGQLERGEGRIRIDHTGLDPALQRLSAIANRLAIAILLASLIIGTALVSSNSPDSLLSRYRIADAGFMLTLAVGLWLLLAILGHRR